MRRFPKYYFLPESRAYLILRRRGCIDAYTRVMGLGPEEGVTSSRWVSQDASYKWINERDDLNPITRYAQSGSSDLAKVRWPDLFQIENERFLETRAGLQLTPDRKLAAIYGTIMDFNHRLAVSPAVRTIRNTRRPIHLSRTSIKAPETVFRFFH